MRFLNRIRRNRFYFSNSTFQFSDLRLLYLNLITLVVILFLIRKHYQLIPGIRRIANTRSTIKLNSKTDVEVKLDKKYDFHYQVRNGGLVLYGNFNESPFEVIELKTNQGINSYLYFKNQFYSLTDKSENINPLVVLTNKELIIELERRR